MTASHQHAPPAGLRVGGYQLLAQLGEGGMGVVHLAARPGGPRVALKVLRPHVVGDEEARARLAREVDTLSLIRSPRVAEILDADPWGEVPYVVTRYVPGLSLQEHVREQGPVQGHDLVWLARCLAEALAAVHHVGVLHRDVKPSNILMEGRAPVLIDFGLARLADDPRLTRVGWLLGTPGYLAPEILFGQDASPASDVHSWGATLAYAATGRAPFGSGPAVAVMDRVRRGEHDLRGLTGPVRDVVVATLHPDPARRPSLGELQWRLSHDGPAPAARPRPAAPVAPVAPVRQAPTAPLVAHRGPDTRELSLVREPTARLDEPDDRLDEPDDLLEEWLREPVPVQGRAPLAERLRRLTLLLGLGAAGAGAIAWAPWLALLVLVLGVWLLRTGSASASAARDRRRLRGGRWYDPTLTALALPYHCLATVPGTILLTLWALGIGLAAALLSFAFAFSEPTSLGLVGAGFVLGLWAGPGGGRVRLPLLLAVRPVAARPLVWLVVAAAVLAVASGFLTLALQTGTHWQPGQDAPWRDIPFSGLR